MIYDVVIIGAGPAGLSAGIYAKRAGLNAIILQDKYSVGSQICNTYEVSNYPGFYNISGQDLYDTIKKHTLDLNVTITQEKVVDIIEYDKKIKKVKTSDNIYDTKTIVCTTGGFPKKYGFDGEDNFVGKGVSYCATCDGAFYKDKIVAIIGGGDVAVEDAIFMSRIAKKVYLMMRGSEMRAAKILQENVKSLENVDIYYEVTLDSIIGEDKVEGGLFKKKGDRILSEFTFDALFIAIGMVPDTSLLCDKVDMDGAYIVAGEDCKTSVDGIYAAGDVRKKQLRQVITACADGANAISSITRYLNEAFN